LFVYQDNRRDLLSATYLTGPNKGYALGNNATVGDDAGAGTIDFANHTTMGYTGVHYPRMPRHQKGWIMMSTYKTNGNGWADNQLMMMQIKPMDENPKVWRIASMPNYYNGDYFDEAPASMNLSGSAVYVSNNWGVPSSDIELFRYDLPRDWNEHLHDLFNVYGQTITVANVEVL